MQLCARADPRVLGRTFRRPGARYAAAATSVAEGGSSCDANSSVLSDEEAAVFGASLYGEAGHELPDTATMASLGCGSPTAVAELHEGGTVLDLGSGGGIDVLLSAVVSARPARLTAST